MARTSWLDEDTELPNLEALVARLDHFTSALADGVVDTDELKTQEAALVNAMKAVESTLDDATHAAVTRVLAEMTAFNIMTVLHELTAERARLAFSPTDEP
jgi:ATP phosphoribosyltransferase